MLVVPVVTPTYGVSQNRVSIKNNDQSFPLCTDAGTQHFEPLHSETGNRHTEPASPKPPSRQRLLLPRLLSGQVSLVAMEP